MCVCVLPVCAHTSVCKDSNEFSYLRDRDLFQGNMGRMENRGLSAGALGFGVWHEVHSCSGDGTSSHSVCVREDSVVGNPSERAAYPMPSVPLVSTVVLAKVAPFPASLRFQNSSPSAFCGFSPKAAGCPVVLCTLRGRSSLLELIHPRVDNDLSWATLFFLTGTHHVRMDVEGGAAAERSR